MLIAFVGIDGAGKTTQIQLLLKALSDERKIKVCKAVPANRKLVERIAPHSHIFKELQATAMALDLSHSIALYDRDTITISDRYTYCIKAYFAAEGKSFAVANGLLDLLPHPDVIIWIDTNPEIAAARVRKRGVAKSLENAAFLTLVRNEYNRILGEMPNVIRVDGNVKPDVIHAHVMAGLEPYLKRRDTLIR